MCTICEELESGFVDGICNVCIAKMDAIIHCDTLEKAEEILKMMKKYPTSKSALLSEEFKC